MIPVSNFEEVKIAWIILEQKGIRLYGFILYTSSDRVLVDYMNDGIFELDILTGKECSVFVLEPPSANWIDYAKTRNHEWVRVQELLKPRVSGNLAGAEEKSKRNRALLQKYLLSNIKDSVIVVGDDSSVSLSDLCGGGHQSAFNRAEAIEIAARFGIRPKSLPCMIFFKSLDSQEVTYWSLKQFDSQGALKYYFREFFDSHEFKTLVYG